VFGGILSPSSPVLFYPVQDGPAQVSAGQLLRRDLLDQAALDGVFGLVERLGLELTAGSGLALVLRSHLIFGTSESRDPPHVLSCWHTATERRGRAGAAG
jgi:hypothetical protein